MRRTDGESSVDRDQPEPQHRSWPARVFTSVGRGIKAWLNMAPGCSACDDPFSDRSQACSTDPEKKREAQSHKR